MITNRSTSRKASSVGNQPHTSVNDLFGAAPAKRVLKGDKKIATERGTHMIEFPGGAIELSRLRNGDYWAHIIVNRGQAVDAMKGTIGAIGEVVSSRIDWHERRLENIPGLPEQGNLTQIAVCIRPLALDQTTAKPGHDGGEAGQ